MHPGLTGYALDRKNTTERKIPPVDSKKTNQQNNVKVFKCGSTFYLKCILAFFLTTHVQPTLAQTGKTSAKTGDYLQIALPVAAFGATFVFDDSDGRAQFLQTFASTIFLTYVGKIGIPVIRPDGSDSYSFISGHTSAATFGATFLMKRYGQKFGIPAFLAAGFVGWSRIKSKKHHNGDVFRGAGLGLLLPHWGALQLHEKAKISPVYLDKNLGLNLKLNW
ncbi:MAG: phosphatase PAP2 family protein [Calditrichaeota bacterium]|nr:MAG: phosphatase PAP2 family protein [Calditrichota bacterium]